MNITHYRTVIPAKKSWKQNLKNFSHVTMNEYETWSRYLSIHYNTIIVNLHFLIYKTISTFFFIHAHDSISTGITFIIIILIICCTYLIYLSVITKYFKEVGKSSFEYLQIVISDFLLHCMFIFYFNLQNNMFIFSDPYLTKAYKICIALYDKFNSWPTNMWHFSTFYLINCFPYTIILIPFVRV